MERESFENDHIADLMNRWFVSIKVDREERPDIDSIYMAYVQATTGGGGWPMSVWLTPDLKPFVGGTYFPPEDRYGRAGFPLILERVADAWKNDRNRIIESSEEILAQLKRNAGASSRPGGGVDTATMDHAYQQFRRSFDSRLGGFGGAPKFPRPSVHNFLLRYWKRTGDEEALEMVEQTLLSMDRGGMNDQLGGGFHRYSVDERWFVPHFEKMLYDQAQLAISYIETFQITENEALELAARRTLDYVMRDMTSPEGAFWSAEDADSAPDATKPREKSEGFFYIWSMGEAAELLGEERAQWFAYRYGMQPSGNVANDPHQEFTGLNILYRAHTLDDTARHFRREPGEMAAELADAERILLQARAKRPRPHLDDKILTAWNGLMISAFARAAAALDEKKYRDAAERAANFILSSMRAADGALLRRYRAGDAGIAGMLDDYAFFTQALLDLYETTFDFARIDQAIALMDRALDLLEDKEGGGFFSSAEPDALRLMPMKDDYDGAEPSGNSVSLMNLLRLSRITGQDRYETAANRLIAAFSEKAQSSSYGLPQMLSAWEFAAAPNREVVIAGDLPTEMTRLLRRKFDPNRVLLAAGPELVQYHPASAEMRGPAVYICENFTCQSPVTNKEELSRLLE